MKKIEVEVPDWAEGRDLYMFAGQEPFWIKQPKKEAQYKTARCNMCGKCCINPEPDWEFCSKTMTMYGEEIEVCKMLEREPGPEEKYACMNPVKPWACIVLRPDRLPHPDCSLRYEVRGRR